MSGFKQFFNIFFLSITILALLMSPFVMYFNYTAGRLTTFFLIVQLLIWIAFSTYTILFLKRLVKAKKY
jgi:hypothetical protein